MKSQFLNHTTHISCAAPHGGHMWLVDLDNAHVEHFTAILLDSTAAEHDILGKDGGCNNILLLLPKIPERNESKTMGRNEMQLWKK